MCRLYTESGACEMTKTQIGLSGLALFVAGGALALQQMATKLPPPYATESVRNNPHVISRPDGAQLKVPQGFHVDEFATGLQRPRVMIYGPGGELLITESVENGTVSILV